MIFHNVEQNTEEWYALRLGKFTASSFKDLFATPSTITFEKAIYKPVFERLTGVSPESFTNEYMQRGHDLEGAARLDYEIHSLSEITNGGFCVLNDWVGCSPDGFVNEDGIIEIKCPAYNTHMKYLISGKLPTQYKWQVHGQLWITEREWCDFVSYYPGLPSLIVRIYRSEPLISDLKITIDKGIEKALGILNTINGL